MERCARCDKRILLGGLKVGDVRYCGETCADAELLPAFTAALEPALAAATQPATVRTKPVSSPRPVRTVPDDSMLVDKEGSKPGLVIAIGVGVAILLSLALHFAESSVDWQLRGLNFWIVVPIGAALNGAIISAAFFAAIRLLDSPPRRATYIAACASAALLCWVTFVISYLTMTDEDGNPLRDILPFTEFMQVVIENSEIQLGRTSRSAVTAGKWGYALYAADCLGFMIGAWFVVRAAGARPFCGKCGRFMAKLGRLARSGDDATAAGTTVGAMQAHLGANDPQRAVETLHAFGAADEKSFFGIALECHGCPMCKDYNAAMTTTLKGAKARRELRTAEFPGNGEIRLK